MRRYLSAAVLAAVALGLAPAAAAQAAVPPAQPLLNPCTTFTPRSVHTVLGVRPGVRLGVKLTSSKTGNPSRTCTVTHLRETLKVTIYAHPVVLPKGLRCFARPKLGAHGRVCPSARPKVHVTYSEFRNRGRGYLVDTINQTLPRQGARLYTFTLAQRTKLDPSGR
jgi:hypothetical protein